MKNPWQSLEEVRDFWSFGAKWRYHLGPAFDSFSAAGFLQKTRIQANWLHCENRKNCWYETSVKGRKFMIECAGDDGSGYHVWPAPDDLGIWGFDYSRLATAVAWALGLDSVEERFLLPRTFLMASCSEAAIPVIMTIPQSRKDFQTTVTRLTVECKKPFILIGPTNRFMDSRCKEALEKCGAEFFDLASYVDLTADGELRARTPGRELFARFLVSPSANLSAGITTSDIYREILAGRVENRDGFKKTVGGLEAVASGNYALRQENEELRQLNKDGYFKFAVRVDGEDFLAFATIMALGNRKAAADHLKIPHRTFYNRVEQWGKRGKDYQLLLRYIDWRKRSSRHLNVTLPQSIQSGSSTGQTENPDTVNELLDKIKTADSNGYPALMADILQALESQNTGNWRSVRQELVDLIKEEILQ